MSEFPDFKVHHSIDGFMLNRAPRVEPVAPEIQPTIMLPAHRWISVYPVFWSLIIAELRLLVVKVVVDWFRVRPTRWFYVIIKPISPVELLAAAALSAIGYVISRKLDEQSTARAEQIAGMTRQGRDATRAIHGATQDLITETSRLKEQGDRLIEKQEELYRQVRSVVVHTNYEDTLAQIKKIAETATIQRSKLCILNPTASFGHMLTFELETILDHLTGLSERRNINDRLADLGRLDAFKVRRAIEELQGVQRGNFDLIVQFLDQCASTGDPRLIYATLSPDGEHGKSPFVSTYLQPSLADALVKFFDTTEDIQTIVQDCRTRIARSEPLEQLYLLPAHLVQPVQHKDAHQVFIDHLVQRQAEDIATMVARRASVVGLARVPMQIFLACADPDWRATRRDICLFMIVNQYTIGRVPDVSSFTTEDPNLVRSFKSVFDGIVATEKIGASNHAGA